jgi:proteic killer suppression protein
VIRSFHDTATRDLFEEQPVPKWNSIARVAFRKLLLVDAAVRLEDLRVPPGNHLESLKGTRRGQHSIRINAQYRLCFRWDGVDAYDVEITDYH